MKCKLAFFLVLSVALSVQAGVPTPDSAMAFYMNKDHRDWKPQYTHGDRTGFIMEFVPKGDSIKSWNEMAAQQIVFTKAPLLKYVGKWKEGLLKADPKVELSEETMADGSILVTYTSVAADEFSMRRFIKGKDGIYMIAYHVRPNMKKPDVMKLWDDIIRSAKLISNPEKGR